MNLSSYKFINFCIFQIRFSQFFISPTFNEDTTSREVKAVHSEHEKNVMSDYWRADSVDKAVCNQTHDYAKFGTGMFYRTYFVQV